MPPKRLTRSANPTLESLPPKSRGKPITANRKARARPENVPDDETPETTDQSYTEAVIHSKGKHVEAQVARKNRAPVVVASTAPVTTHTREKRVSTGKSIIGASIWDVPEEASTASKGIGGGKATGMKRVATAVQGKKSPTRETQEVIVIARGQGRWARELPELSNEEVEGGEGSSEDEEPRGPVNKHKTQTTQKGYSKAIPKIKGASKGSNKSPRLSGLRVGDLSAPHASTPKQAASPRGESSKKQLLEEREMNNVLSAAIKTPPARLSQGSAGQEEDPGDGYYESSDESLSDDKHLGITDKIKKSRKSYNDYPDPEPEVSEAAKSWEATPRDGDYSPSEDDDDDNLTLFLSRIQEYSAVLSSIRENMQELISNFDELKALQNPPRVSGEVGYVKSLHQITNTIINNHSPRLSADERHTLQQLDEAMATLSDFYQETKGFETTFRRLQKSNLTQRSNIDKCQAGIKKTMKVRGYAITSLSTTIVNEEMVRREKNKKAARKRTREIEAVVRERERIALGYQTPESAEDRSKRGREEETEDEVEGLQKRIRVGQNVSQYEEDGYNSLSDEEGLPIVIDEDDVEVVHVEGFGERQKKAREREERRERGEGEVEVLEDHEWEEHEIDALLHGIERFQGIFRFEKIMNLYGFGNRAPLKNRSVEAIKEKAMELKKEIIDSGEEEMLGHFWDGI